LRQPRGGEPRTKPIPWKTPGKPLSAAEDQIKELSTDLRYYQDRAHRAEQWLLRISKEVDEKFLESAPSHPRHNAL
jgi:hypothetical protein